MTARKLVFGLAAAIVLLSCGAMSLAAGRAVGLF
jgi:hypothetical protein